MNAINWVHVRAKLREAVLVLPHFFKNPVQGMRTIPQWDWPTILILQSAFAAGCAVLTSAMARSYLGVITGLIVGPMTQLSIVFICAGFFYYVIFFFFKREVPYRQVYLTLVFASIPALVMNILSPILPVAEVLGVAASLLLLYVAFVDTFYLERVKARNLLAAIMAIYLAGWVTQMLQSRKASKSMHLKATPASLDILEKEFKDED